MKPENQFLMLFAGPPASGKTTVARTLAELLGEQSRVVHLQSDEIRHMVISPVYSKHESITVYSSMKAMSKIFLRNGYSVIADATFTRVAHRNPFRALARRFDVKFLAVYLKCSLQTALKRNAERTGWRFVPPERVAGIFSSFEFDQSLVVVDTETHPPREAAELILSLLKTRIEA